jgi:putative ABC transport system permease protein
VDSSIANSFPVRGVGSRVFEIEGRTTSPDNPNRVQFMTIGSGYFDVIGAPAIVGRDFNDRDRLDASKVVLVNQSFAALFWPGEQPLGKRLRPADTNQSAEWYTVVGIVPNVMQGDALRQQFKPLVYAPARQNPMRVALFMARTRVPPDWVAQAVRSGVQAIDPDVTFEPFATLKERFAFERDYMDVDHSELGKHAKVAPIFAGIALLLAAIGLSAVIAHSVTQRTKEIGVRIAIGAAARDIRRMILREGMSPVAIGMILGLAASLAVNRVLQSQLVGVSPYDPATITGAPLVLTLIALVACHIPARRAVRVDPVVALRHE